MKNFTLVFIHLLFTCYISNAQQTILHCGKLIDVKNKKVLESMSVIIEGNKITDVVNGYVQGNSPAKVIDLKNHTIMPGLMDMHVHVESETKRGAVADRFTMNPPDIAFESVKYANVTLMA